MHAGIAARVWLPADVPVELGREEARELARRELADPAYDAEPPLLQQVVAWIIERIQELIDRTAGALSGSVGRADPRRGARARRHPGHPAHGPTRAARDALRSAFPTERRTAAEYRAAADAAAARQDWSSAVIERYRAVVLGFEERGLLDPRPGRTADEAAAEGGAVLPELASGLRAGSILFDAVRYGGRTATAADDALMRRLDKDAIRARPGSADSGLASAVPR